MLPSVRTLVVGLASAAAATLLVSACSHDGRTLAPVDPQYTTTSGAVISDPSGDVSPVGSLSPFALSTDGFPSGGELPPEFTCSGAGVSPPLSWTELPPGAELAIVMRERSAEGTVQWIVTGIDPTIQGFGSGSVPEGAVQQANATGVPGYLAPCPPAGTGVHTYDITLHVLAEPLTVDPAQAAADLAATVETGATASATVSGTITTN